MKHVSERAWIRQVIEKYEELEKHQPLGPVATEEPPEWVYRAMAPLVGISHPKLTKNSLRKWTARDLGYFLGRQSALDDMMWGEVPLSADVVQEAIQFFAAHERALGLASRPDWQVTKKQMGSQHLKRRRLFRKFIDEVIIAARNRPHTESVTFLKAFGDGSTVSDSDFDNRKVGVGERIAWVMFHFWQPISKFESVSQLHQFLSAAAKPMKIAIALKRVEKLCSRIGLKFKGRGRPKKKIQTNPPPTP